ncbi:ABC transporter permease [Streptomyces sp. NRRL F-5123]|uniref:ABC transporter permease n=1 Tax=Streptomyces sp. NRRL F-5123 TaxID=1463856 RepID=UPI000694B412|nr:ABC transporter permease [Streptomyces sp. NRRL F-5123]
MSVALEPAVAVEAHRGRGFSGLLWLTWRQHRWALVCALGLTVVLAGWLAWLGHEMTVYFHQCHDRPCLSGTPQDAALSSQTGPFRVADHILQFVEYEPLLIAVFLGVPLLAREHEQRTLLLAWSQDVSPQRWLWTKTALLGGCTAVCTAAISLAADHVARVMSDVTGDGLFEGDTFLDSGMLPLALGVAMFAVGVALGAAIRRVLPAALVAVAFFVGLFVLVSYRYPYLMAPLSRLRSLPDGTHDPGPAGGPNALRIKAGITISPERVGNLYDAAGRPLDAAGLDRLCPFAGPDAMAPTRLPSCMAGHHLLTRLVYQPADRIGSFHAILAAGYAGLGVLALAAVWLTVRRTSLTAG